MSTTFASENHAGEQTTAVLDDAVVRTDAPAQPTPAGVPAGYDPAQDQAPYRAPQSPTDERARTFAITSFVLGLVSVVSGWTFIAPIIGLIFGILALRRNTSERALALWGVWTSAAMLAISVIAVAFGAMFLGFGLLAAPYMG